MNTSWFDRKGPEWLADCRQWCQKSASRMNYPCSASRQGLKPDWSTASLASRSSREPLSHCTERSVISVSPPLSGCICLLALETTSCYTHTRSHTSISPALSSFSLPHSASLIFTLLCFPNTDSFLVAVLGHVFLCYPAVSSRWDFSKYISDKSKQKKTTMYSLHITRSNTLHLNVSAEECTIFAYLCLKLC